MLCEGRGFLKKVLREPESEEDMRTEEEGCEVWREVGRISGTAYYRRVNSRPGRKSPPDPENPKPIYTDFWKWFHLLFPLLTLMPSLFALLNYNILLVCASLNMSVLLLFIY